MVYHRYCWSQRLGKWLPDSLHHLELVSAQPNIQLQGMPRTLTSFSLHDASVSDSAISALFAKGTFSKLHSLDLSCTSMMGEFSKSTPQKLTRMFLTATPLITVNFPRNLVDMIELDLSHTFVADEVLPRLPPNLQIVNLSYTKVTPDAL